MNVLHVHSGNIFGGVERMLETLAPATSGRVPVQSTFALCFDGAVMERLRAAGATVHRLGPVHARQMSEIRQRPRALSVVLRSEPMGCRPASTRRGRRRSSGRRFSTAACRSCGGFTRRSRGRAVLEFWARRSRPALVLCNSRYTADNGRARMPGCRTRSSIRRRAMRARRPEVRARVRESLGTAPDATVVVLAARMEAGKGQSQLIAALAQLGDPGWEAWIIGGAQQPTEHAYLDALRRQAEAAGLASRIRFLGQRSDVEDLFEAADIYCQPNLAPDSFGLSFIEALSAGLPVVTTRLGAAAEIVDHSCGVLIEPGSLAALRDALARLIERTDDRRVLSAGACARAREFCDLSRSVSKLASEFARLSLVPQAT